ncbi:MAG: signal peptidase II [Deltaproteobacteria bacterium]
MKGKGSGPLLLAIAAGVVALDQLTKLWVVSSFHLYESREVIPGFFHLTYLTNTGAAFGFLAGKQNALRQVFFVGIAVAALLAMAYFYRTLKDRSMLYTVAIGLICGGAVGNLIDRLRLSSVMDFLDFFIGRYHWPAFNVADSAITTGVVLFLLASLLEGKKEQRH